MTQKLRKISKKWCFSFKYHELASHGMRVGDGLKYHEILSPSQDMACMVGWRSLENWQIDARLIMLYKIIYGYVAVEVPSYFEKPQRYTRHMHPLAFRQIHTASTYASTYYQQSFYPAPIVLWNRLLLLKLSFWKILISSVRSFIGPLNSIHGFYPAFKLHLLCTNTMSFIMTH